MKLSKEQITFILDSNPAAVDAAIIILANNQTEGELRSKNTHNLNGEGFSAAYGKVGTRFYEFVTGIQMSSGKKKWPARSLSHPKANQVLDVISVLNTTQLLTMQNIYHYFIGDS